MPQPRATSLTSAPPVVRSVPALVATAGMAGRYASDRGLLDAKVRRVMANHPLNEPNADPRPTTRLIYVHDPLCGWCYAMQPALRALLSAYPDLSVETFNIGLWVGSEGRPIAHGFREHLQAGVPKVETLSSVRFGSAFRRQVIDNDHYIYESGTAALAMQCIKRLASDKQVEFIHDFQAAFFVEGRSASDLTTFVRLAASYGISVEDFARVFYSVRTSEQMQAERRQAATFCNLAGSQGVPVFLLSSGDRLLPVGHRGCAPQPFVQAVEAARRVIETA